MLPLFVTSISFVPLLLWRYHASLHPEGSFATLWLYNGGNIRFTGAYFRWLIFERLNRLILGAGGFVLFFVGLLKSINTRNNRFFLYYLISVAAYAIVFAKGNVTHDYYQLPFIPVVSQLLALGIIAVIADAKTRIAKVYSTGVVICLVLIMYAFSWYDVRGYYQINNGAIIEAGERVDAILPKDALVIAPYNADPTFLYFTNRHGWTLGYYIEDKIKDGATHYVTTTFDDEANFLAQKYTLLEKTERYMIIKLK